MSARTTCAPRLTGRRGNRLRRYRPGLWERPHAEHRAFGPRPWVMWW